jgi:Flp pilus assembly pilin Flp
MLRYLKSERGASAAEYALILAVLGGATALSAAALKTAMQTSIAGAAAEVASTGGTTVTPSDPQPTDPPPTDPCKGKGKKCK